MKQSYATRIMTLCRVIQLPHPPPPLSAIAVSRKRPDGGAEASTAPGALLLDSSHPAAHIAANNMRRFLLGTFNGVSQRYLHEYLDEFCYRFYERHAEREIPFRLLQRWAAHAPVLLGLDLVDGITFDTILLTAMGGGTDRIEIDAIAVQHVPIAASVWFLLSALAPLGLFAKRTPGGAGEPGYSPVGYRF